MNRRLYKTRSFLIVQKCLSMLLIVTFVFSNLGTLFDLPPIDEAEAATVTIDASAHANGTSHLQTNGQTVFIDDQTGYKFYRDVGGYCVYKKTTNGGGTWGATTTVDSQTDCSQVTVWYDRWTPGDTGTYIHIATLDPNPDDIWYNRLDTNGDTLLLGGSPVSMLTGSGQGGTSLNEGENFVSITKATNGILYAISNDGSGTNDSFIVECSTSCNVNTNWTETTFMLDVASDQNILVPLTGGDIMVIQRDISADLIRSRVWDDGTGAWDAGWTTVDATSPENATYDVGMAVAVSLNRPGDIYLAYISRNTALGLDDIIESALYSSGSWTAKTNLVRYTEYGITNIALALDSSNDDVYVAYSLRTTPVTANTGNILWRKSSDGMTTWSPAYGPVNSSPQDIYGVDLNRISDERLYISWFDNGAGVPKDIYGDTLVDLHPGINVTATDMGVDSTYDSYTQVTIDSDAHTNGSSNSQSGSQTVFIDDQTGYKFFRDWRGDCVYRKTTNGGSSWSGTTTVDAQLDCHQVTVWYDQWTPGDTGTNIHIATMDVGNDDIWYTKLDTSSDTLTTTVSMMTGSGQGGTTLTEGENFVSISKGTDGTLYALSNDGTTAVFDSFVVECSTSCQTNTNWTETGTNPFDAASDQSLLVPLASGDMMLINRDISADLIRFKIWDNSNWSGTWTTIDATSPEHATTYDVTMSAVPSLSNPGDVYLAYVSRNTTPGSDDIIETALYTGGSWSAKTSPVSLTVTGLTGVAIALDTDTEDVYVAYTAQATANTAGTANVLWRRSLDGMTTWSPEYGIINTSADDMYGVDLGLSSNDRIYATWFDGTDNDTFGANIMDLTTTDTPVLTNQVSTTTASTSGLYLGGTFVLYNTNDLQNLDVTGITVTESGTIDGDANIANVKLLYEMDTSAPYNCSSVTYGGSETQFGSTDTNGFSGANGVSSFSGSTVTVGTTSTMCVYVVIDVLNNTPNSSTIEISIDDPSSDVTVTSSTAGPSTSVAVAGTTNVINDNVSQIHYHWRNDDDTESAATSKTSGVEDTNFNGYQRTPVRLRFEVSNEGGTTSASIPYRLEYALATTTCSAVTNWTDVGASDDDWNMYNSSYITDGNDTTDVAPALGGMADENTTFKTPNGGVMDIGSETAGIVLTTSEYVDLEYSIQASTTAQDGNTYCMRLSNAGTPLDNYAVYPQITIQADVNVTASGTQSVNLNTPSTNQYLGGMFVLADATGAHTISSIQITESGTIDAESGLDNILLRYDMDTSAPYDCSSESYSGGDTQYGTTDTDGFSSANGTSTFTASLIASTTATVCLYVVLDVTSSAVNGETIEIEISNATTDVVLTTGSAAPASARALLGTTTLVGSVLTQIGYHFRADNGNEGAATSLTQGTQNTVVDNISQSTPVRLRMEVSNEGAITSPNTALRLEYGTRITTCSAIGIWIDVGATLGAFDMYNSSHITEGGDTANIGEGIGGLSDENSNFLSPNSALKDTSSQIATTTLASTDFMEAEFSVKQTANAAFDTTYCFRLTNAGTEINAYTVYPELTTSPERDFEIQSNVANFSGTSITLTAGIDYVAPSASTSAFVRITNSGYTGAGDSSAGGNSNADDVTAYISNASNIMTSFTITRPGTAIATTTRVVWEIVEFIGASGSDNEMKVRAQGSLTYGLNSLTATGTAVNGVVTDGDVVVFITGQDNVDTGVLDYNTGQSVSSWLSSSDQPVFRRGESNGDANHISYAVVEFTGINWKVQRAEHTYTAAGTTETESITAVNNITRTFIHAQKRIGAGLQGEDEYGQEVWLSSMGAVSFFLQSGATSPTLQTSVAWIIENTQTSSGAMVVTQKNDFTTGGSEPLTLSVPLTGYTLDDLTNTSISANNRAAGTGTLYPRPIAGYRIASTTAFEIWRSDTGARIDYRVEIIEWPTAGLALRQDYYWFFVDNDALDPTDIWPDGIADLGESTVLAGGDEPLGEGEHIRVRMSLAVLNATLPEYTLSNKLQFAERDTVCGAIDEGSWTDVGAIGSGAIWRGYDAPGVADGTALSTDPPAGGALNLTYADVAGTYEESNNSAVNPYTVPEGDYIEFDWHIQQNGATPETTYCLRMVDSSGSLLGSYTDWPQLRTSSFTPKSQNWRWYSDAGNETPTTAMENENVSPIDIANGSTTKLRVTVKETENIARDDVRFKLQYSEYADFSTAYDVHSTTTCIASSTWCYYNGGGTDNQIVSTKVLSDVDACSTGIGDGCGTHNEGPHSVTGFRHESSAATEYEFTLQAGHLRANAVYYFRLYDITQDIPVVTNTGETYPSLVAEGASLVFNVDGVTAGTFIDSFEVDINSTPTTIPFGLLNFDTDYEAGYRLNINTNATQGYQVLMYAKQQLLNAYGGEVPPVTGTNAVPTSWAVGCSSSLSGCFGYHAEDDNLGTGYAPRFGANDTFARLSTTTAQEVMYSSIPTDDTHDILYRLRVTEQQPAGDYDTTITYIAVPVH